jgi:hypothetical protein
MSTTPLVTVKPVGCTAPPLYSTCIWAAMYSVINQCCRTSYSAFFHTCVHWAYAIILEHSTVANNFCCSNNQVDLLGLCSAILVYNFRLFSLHITMWKYFLFLLYYSNCSFLHILLPLLHCNHIQQKYFITNQWESRLVHIDFLPRWAGSRIKISSLIKSWVDDPGFSFSEHRLC